MTIQQYTRKIDRLRWQIESKKERILVLECIATSTTSPLTGMPHNPSGSKSKMADAIVQKLYLEKSIKDDEAAINALHEKMSAAIEQVDSPKHQAVLYKRYIRNMTLEAIAEEIGYCERTVRRLINEANRMLGEKLSD